MDEDVRPHPRFSEAAITLSRTVLDHHSGNRLLRIVTNDRGRFVISLFVVAFAQDAAGLTAGRLASICATTGLCSGGRARAIFQLMQWAGYVERRGSVFQPSEKLLSSQGNQVRRTLAVLTLLRPNIADALDAPGFVEGYCAAAAAAFQAGHRAVKNAPELVGILDRNAGLFVLLALYLAEAGVEPGPFNVAGLARRFHVSRPHIDRLLKLACERELAVRTADGVRPGPTLRDAVDRLLSTMMVFEIAFATSAATRTGWAPQKLAKRPAADV